MESPLPDIVRIVLSTSAKLFLAGEMASPDFRAKVRRIEKEELAPRGFCLSIRRNSDRAVSFAVTRRSSERILDHLTVFPAGQDKSIGLRKKTRS